MSGYTGMKRMPHAPRRHSECRSFIAAAVVQLPAVNQSLTADGDQVSAGSRSRRPLRPVATRVLRLSPRLKCYSTECGRKQLQQRVSCNQPAAH